LAVETFCTLAGCDDGWLEVLEEGEGVEIAGAEDDLVDVLEEMTIGEADGAILDDEF